MNENQIQILYVPTENEALKSCTDTAGLHMS
jgi:hypothetical protein